MALLQRVDRSLGVARAPVASGLNSSRRLCPIKASAKTSTVERNEYSIVQRALLGVTAGVAAAAVLLAGPPAAPAAEPFLSAVREEITQQREASQGSQLCATPFGVDVVGLTVFVALLGAAVGGYTARQRKAEAEKLNEQLRKINASLRQQTRAATAAGVTLPPSSSSSNGNGNGRSSSSSSSQPQTVTATITLPKPLISTASPAAAAAAAAAAKPAAAQTLMSMDEDEMSAEQLACRETLRAGKRLLKQKEGAGAVGTWFEFLGVEALMSMDEDEMSAEQLACRETLRTGKRLLKQKEGAAAQANFEKALVLAQSIGERVQERRAVRGLAASCKLQGRYQEAIGYYERVLLISQAMGEFTGDADAYGSIADCYTEMDRFDKAAEFYDKYIQHMED
uniref:Uncharacterized protein n=1 Tax=Tetradesmus obliquus TaxID=3088 RepID=A0A383W2R7_TETOB